MKKIISFLSLLLFASNVFSQWEIVGGETTSFIPNPGFGNGQSQSVKQLLQFHPETFEPYVFFDHFTTNVAYGPTIAKFNGTSWDYIDTQFDTSASSDDDIWGFYFKKNSNLPVVLYRNSYFQNGSNKRDFKVLQRVGNIWENITGNDNSLVNDVYFGLSYSRMIGHPISGEPVIPGKSPQGNAYGNQTVVAIFNNSKWEYLGDVFSEVGATEFDIDYNTTTNVPYVITRYQDINTFMSYIKVFKFEGTWTEIGAVNYAPRSTGGTGYRIRIDQQTGDIYTLCPENYNNPNNAQTFTLTVKKWNGTTWETLGTPDQIWPTTALSYDLEIHPVTGEPYVAFFDGNSQNPGNLNIRKWNGQSWESITSQPNLVGTLGEKLDMVFHPQTNIPYIVSTNGKLYKCTPDNATASIDEITNKQIIIYPNPSKHKITVSGIDVKKLVVFDTAGRKILSTNNNQLEVKGLSAGVYILQVTTNSNNNITKKIIKQ